MSETAILHSSEQSARHQPERLDDDLDRLTLDYMRGRADRIAKAVAEPGGKHEAYKRTHEKFVQNEANPELKTFGKLLLLAPLGARTQQRLDEISAGQIRGGRLAPEVRAEQQKLVRAACAYNQLWGKFVEEHEAELTPEQVTDWLERASGNNTQWAHRLINGVVAEVRAGKLLRRVRGLTNLRHGDLEQDLAGQDFVFDRTVSGDMSIDVKTGRHRPELPVSRDRDTGNLLLSIDPAHGKGFEVDEKYAPGYVAALEQYLAK